MMKLEKRLNTPQRRLQHQIDKGYMITQCAVTGQYKDPLNGEYVGFRLHKPYYKISHGYCSEWAENYLSALDLDRRKNYTKRYEYNRRKIKNGI